MSEDGGVRGGDPEREDGSRSAQDPVRLEGGEPACWLQRVCPDCGALTEQPGRTCWRCGRPLGDEEEGSGL